MKSLDVQQHSASGADHDLLALCLQVLPVWARHLDHSRGQSEAAVSEMMSAFAELGPQLDQANSGPQIERMYKGFQYQDRLNQMLALLHADMQRLQQALALADGKLDPATWLARLQAGYVMAEQHELHAGTGVGSMNAPTTDDDTTFF